MTRTPFVAIAFAALVCACSDESDDTATAASTADGGVSAPDARAPDVRDTDTTPLSDTSPAEDVADVDDAEPAPFEITAADFPCITDMEAVRGFHLTNLLGDTDAAVAIAEAGFVEPVPPGTLIQLIPQEAMVKGLPGSSPETDDWEFFLINPSGGDAAIVERGFDTIANAAGSCWGCHVGARDRDAVCEQTGSCADAAVPRAVVDALVGSDPRCE